MNNEAKSRLLDVEIARDIFDYEYRLWSNGIIILVAPTFPHGESTELTAPLGGDWIDYIPAFSQDFALNKRLVDKLGSLGFYLKLVSPFRPETPPSRLDILRYKRWERTRNHWVASFDYHGTSDTLEIWQATGEDPLIAICKAAILLIPEIQK